MRKKLLMKSLLVAAALCVGGNAWAEEIILTPTQTTELKTTGKTTTSENSGRATTVYYNAEATSWNAGQSQVDAKAFKNSQSSYDGSYIVITKFDASTALSEKTLVSATLKFYSQCTVSTKSSAVKVALIGTGWDATTATWSNTNTAAIMDATEIHGGTSVNTTKQQLSIDVKSYLEDDDDKVVGFAIYTGTARDQEITSLTLEITATDASSVTSYSIEKYEVGGSLISSETGIAGVVGNTVSVEDALKATFYSADKNKKYVFDTTNESNVLSKELVADAASNVLKLYFKAYGKHTATVHSVCGSNVVADITGSWYADETPATLYWPKVVSCSDGYYVISANSEDPLYGHTFSTSELEKTVTYTLDENIVYYAEYENILTDKNSYVYFPEKSSKGGSRCIQKSGVMKTAMNLATAGVYDIILAGGNRDGSHTCDVKVYLIDSESNLSEETIINRTLTNGEWMGEETASNVSIPAGSEIYFANDNGEGNAKFAADYIIVRKSNVSVPVTAAGWATLYTTVPLDFSGVEGLTAYTASLSGSTVTLTAVDNVPANTGVVLKGAAKTYEIPAIASSTTAKGDLEGSTTAVDVTADAENVYYVLAKSGDADARFAKVSSGSIAAGKAYLKVAKAGAREFFAIGGDDVTAIESVKAQQMNGEVYNLNGQRVAAPQKGLYIVNGKKVVLK